MNGWQWFRDVRAGVGLYLAQQADHEVAGPFEVTCFALVRPAIVSVTGQDHVGDECDADGPAVAWRCGGCGDVVVRRGSLAPGMVSPARQGRW